MNSEISQELKKKWREEFESCFKGIFNFKESSICPWEYRDNSTMDAWGCYLAARKKAQEEREDAFKAFILDIAEDYERQLETTKAENSRLIKLCQDRYLKSESDLSKRDKLLEQAKEYVNYFDCRSEQCELSVEQWLKDYEELGK